MRLFNYYIGSIAMLLMLFSCRKEKSAEDSQIPPIIAQWEFQEGGSLFGGDMDTASIHRQSGISTLDLKGHKTGDQDWTIVLQIMTENISLGEYNNPFIFFQYSDGGTVVFQNSPLQSQPFSVVISAIDSVSVSGTFSGTVIDSSGAARTISEGKFSAPISGGSFVAPGVTGQLTIWTKTLCGNGDPIKIVVNGQEKEVTSASSTEPTCGADEATTFTLPVNTYSVLAICGTDSVSYNIQILENTCTLLQIDFNDPQPLSGDYFPLLQTWTYGNIDDFENDTLTISSSGDSTINEKTYTVFRNEKTGGLKFYRKEGSSYYECATSSNFTVEPPLTEQMILQDDLPEGSTWFTEPYKLTPHTEPPQPFTVKLKRTITGHNFAGEINGVVYHNLIEVRTDLLVQNPNGDFEDNNSSYTTTFAKGIGIVYYQDLSDGSEWGIRHFIVQP